MWCFIISPGTIRRAGERLAWTCLSLSLSVTSGAVDGRRRPLSCSLWAVWEDRRLNIPGKKTKMTRRPRRQKGGGTDTEGRSKRRRRNYLLGMPRSDTGSLGVLIPFNWKQKSKFTLRCVCVEAILGSENNDSSHTGEQTKTGSVCFFREIDDYGWNQWSCSLSENLLISLWSLRHLANL